MCTLPITLQGLPLDSHITQKWHTADCDGSNNCICKQQDLLTEQDVDWCLFEKTLEEDQASSQFSDLMTWAQLALWRHLPGKPHAMFFMILKQLSIIYIFFNLLPNTIYCERH